MDHLDKFDVLTNVQHDFRQKRSCESQLLTTCKDFVDCLDSGSQIDAILLDFSKAFTRSIMKVYSEKSDHYRIRNNIHSWLTSFLTNRTQKVVVEGQESTSKPVLSGVPQGTVLGPLFILTTCQNSCRRAQS